MILLIFCIVLMFLEVLITYIGTYKGWVVEGNPIFNKIVDRPVLMLLFGEIPICIILLCTFYMSWVPALIIISFLLGILTARVVNNIYMMMYGVARSYRNGKSS
jgi:hypothetical protein